MSNMVLGTYTFATNPSDATPIEVNRSTANIITYSSVGFFSWGASIVGKIIELTWTYMPADMYSSLKTLEAADATIIFDPQDGTSKTYNVEILSIYGKYCLGKLGYASTTLRKDVKVTLLIIGEVP
jgi:hypothetical protein